jgi:O-antigen ligase
VPPNGPILAQASASPAHEAASDSLPGDPETAPEPAPHGIGRWPAAALSVIEWALLGLATPFLLFPGRHTLLGLLPLAAIWGLRRVTTGRWSVGSPAHLPMGLLLLALAVSLVPSIALEYSAHKFWGIVLGLAVFSTCLNTCRSPHARAVAAQLFLLGGALLAVVGLVGMAEPMSKLFGAVDLYTRLPRTLTAVQTSTIVTQGVNPNQVAGTLTLFVPLAMLTALAPGRLRLVARVSLLVMLPVLLLTQSRGAIVGVALATAAGALWVGGRRVRLAVAGAALATAILGVAVLARLDGAVPGCALWDNLWTAPAERAAGEAAAGSPLLAAPRLELWERAVVMVLDMPVTGVGLNTFPLILPRFYPSEYYDDTSLVAHAHNLALHSAVDLGLLGLAAVAMIVVVAVLAGMNAARGGADRTLALGLLLGLLAHAVFNAADAVALGAKTGPALWIALGLLAATAVRLPAAAARPAHWWRRAWLAPLVAIAAVALLAAPLALNAALVVLHQDDAARRLDEPGAGALVGHSLAIAHMVAWGPYAGRGHAAEALVARLRGDRLAEATALQAAAAAAPWDTSVTDQLGALHLAEGDLPGATAIWGPQKTLRVLLQHAERANRAGQPDTAVGWYRQAQAVAPEDWRAYAAVAETLGSEGRYAEATPQLVQALRLRGAAPGRGAPDESLYGVLARRLDDSGAPLPMMRVPLSRPDARLFARTALALDYQGDPTGALFAARAAVDADRITGTYWDFLARLHERYGQTELAQQARSHAETARCWGA